MLTDRQLAYNELQPKVEQRARDILGDALDYVALRGPYDGKPDEDLGLFINDGHDVTFEHLLALSREFGTKDINFSWERGGDLSDVTPGGGPEVMLELLNCGSLKPAR